MSINNPFRDKAKFLFQQITSEPCFKTKDHYSSFVIVVEPSEGTDSNSNEKKSQSNPAEETVSPIQ